MNIFDYAMQMEKEGEAFYRQLIEQTNNKGIRKILTMLADEEEKHYNAIKEIRAGRSEMTETTILHDATNVFAVMKESSEKLELDTGQIALYEKAQYIELKSKDFYLEKADLVEHDYQRDLFLRLAEEEQKHYFLLDNIIEFVARPDYWLENAEFCHIEQY